MKQNKLLLGILAVVVIAGFLLSHGGDESWQPSSASNPKKQKSRQISYNDLRRAAFSETVHDTVPPVPAAPKDPFNSVGIGTQTGGHKAVSKNIVRPYLLKGIIQKTPLYAVILDAAQVSHVVRAGESFDDVTVISISAGTVILKDSHGEFTLIEK